MSAAADWSAPLAGLTIGTDRVTADVIDHVTRLGLSLTTREVSEATIVLEDPGLRLLGSGLLAGRPWITYGALRLEVAAVETAGGTAGTGEVTITARPRVTQALRRRRGPITYSGLSPTEVLRVEVTRAGGTLVAEPTATRPTITVTGRDGDTPAESVWAAADRLAGEVGFVLFEAAGVVYFGRPSWLIRRAGVTRTVRWAGPNTAPGVIGLPQCRRSVDADDDQAVTVTLTVDPATADDWIPGDALALSGVPTFEGRYLIDGVAGDRASGRPLTVTASTPIDPEPQPPADEAQHSDGGTLAVTVPGTAAGNAAGWVDPLPGASLSSGFGPRRSPGGIGSTNHKGVDLSAPNGTRILAARAGRVTFAGSGGGYGLLVKIDHGGGIETRYAHQQRVAVSVGQTVAAGQVIGYVDTTGNSTGPHLHYEVRINGVAVNPVPTYLRR